MNAWVFFCYLIALQNYCKCGFDDAARLDFKHKLEMWANAQRDGCPAEYRWRPLFNAVKFGWRLLLEYRAVMLPRRETRWNLLGCPRLANSFQPLLRRSSAYYEDVEEVLVFNKFFFWLCDGAQMAIFGDFFASCVFSEPCAADFRPAS